jgi:RNA polymerase sigma-70 factor, ECF subfamily
MRKTAEKTVTPPGKEPEGAAFVSPEMSGSVEDRSALDQMFSVTYVELRRLAFSLRWSGSNPTLNPTALVNEAWLRLANTPKVASTSRLHFKRIAARAMRQILVEAARRRNATKRGAEVQVTFDPAAPEPPSRGADVLALDRALDALAEVNPRQATVVESRFFGGLDVPETAALLNISEATALRDWRAAKAWLARELRTGR